MGVNYYKTVHVISCCNSYFNLPSSTLSYPLCSFPEYLGLLPIHPPYCNQSDLFELKTSCHLPLNLLLKHFNGFPLLFGKKIKIGNSATIPKMSFSPLQSNFIKHSHCVFIFSFLWLYHSPSATGPLHIWFPLFFLSLRSSQLRYNFFWEAFLEVLNQIRFLALYLSLL